MSRNNQQRRASKRRDRVRRAAQAQRRSSRPQSAPPHAGPSPFGQSPAPPGPSQPEPLDTGTEQGGFGFESDARNAWFGSPAESEALARRNADASLQALITRAIRLQGSSSRHFAALIQHLAQRELAASSNAQRRILDEQLTQRMLAVLTALWEHGWQPTDLLHVARRSDPKLAPLAAALVTRQSRRLPLDHAPEVWRSQLSTAEMNARAAGLLASPTLEFHVIDTQQRAGMSLFDAWSAALRLAVELECLPPLTALTDPPSHWAKAARRAPARAVGDDRDKLLTKIRALLAKAEATDYAAEAEALTAKAQDLMTRHSIDQALLNADDERPVDVTSLRVHIEAPYAGEKMRLLAQVARSNRCRPIWLDQVGIGTLVGTPIDVDQVELLFTSLLIQATRAMAEAGAHRAGSYDRSASFRRSFLVSYAVRIGERLEEAASTATADYGKQLVPVLQRQADAVEAEFDRLFPDTVPMGGSQRYSQRGWEAGRAAADRATFVAGRLTSD